MAALVDRAPLLAPLVVVAGPTASGKTALALALAEQFSGEIVSCDSVAVYRGMEIGTAKPTLAERARVPHHLIDVAEPDQPCTAGDYSRLAREAIVRDRQHGQRLGQLARAHRISRATVHRVIHGEMPHEQGVSKRC